jgi:ribosomal-protein-alanine N-acetyltransferase
MSRKKSLIRLMTSSDLDGVLAIENACYSVPWTSGQLVEELENPVSSILVCEIEGEIAGFICYWLVAGEMQILNIATAPQRQRRGVGELLLNRAFSHCQQVGLTAAWLEVRVGNRGAINLYQRNGFTNSGIRRGYYRDGEDALLMVREFDKCKVKSE